MEQKEYEDQENDPAYASVVTDQFKTPVPELINKEISKIGAEMFLFGARKVRLNGYIQFYEESETEQEPPEMFLALELGDEYDSVELMSVSLEAVIIEILGFDDTCDPNEVADMLTKLAGKIRSIQQNKKMTPAQNVN